MHDDQASANFFHDDLPDLRTPPRYKIVRTPPRVRTPYLIISERVRAKPTHWLRSRTSPCAEHDGCEGCVADIEVRWKVYCFVYTPAIDLVNILELTDHAGARLLEFQKSNGSIRGYKITVWRDGKKDNSPVECSVARVLDPTIIVPPCPDLEVALNRIWHVRTNRESRPLFHVPTIDVRLKSLHSEEVLPLPVASTNGHQPKKRSK